ncbi:hypothetical protein ACFOYW_06050 [Gryllotalpicola reticulitermitis]|uniref:Uncharacterized protein n=1 Tax=Gryllotalpicola reticulitermitis TaxID=1184153 RepID=A0ABV8Q3Q5_9MICO
MDEEERQLLRRAQCVIVRAKLLMLEELALQKQRHQRGLAVAPLWPPAESVLVASFDGVPIGRIYRVSGTVAGRTQWSAVPLLPAKTDGLCHPTPMSAARRLLDHHRRITRCRALVVNASTGGTAS